jgi:tRNA pseudouridine synthase 10
MTLEYLSNIVDPVRKILSLGPICDSCFGRQFAKLSTGLTNAERGRAIKIFLAMAGSTDESGRTILKELAPSSENVRLAMGLDDATEQCWVCLGLMEPDRLKRLADMALRELRYYQYNSFLVGTRMSGLLAENEEILLTDGESKYAEPLKSELNREVGKLIAAKTEKTVSFDAPDIVVLLNLAKDQIELEVNSLYIYGKYRKLARGFPQTRWPCRECGGAGCKRCNNTGRMYQESVDELIKDPVIEAARSEDTVFHGAGREDIDAKMLGTGRPFVVEATSPMVRDIDLKELERDINVSAAGKVEVSELAFTNKKMVERLKKASLDKTYMVLVEFDGEVSEEKLKSVLKDLIGTVEQRTPTRVSHRRADKVRIRKVYNAEVEEVLEKTARITIHCEGGLYVKELVSSDDGRTKPSLADALGVGAKVIELDVINVGEE